MTASQGNSTGGDGKPSPEEASYASIDRVLEHAQGLLTGDRAREYGDPVASHEVIATLWGTYLGQSITPQQVAIMMTLLKIARLKSDPQHQDSMVDGVAYLAIAKACQERNGDQA